MNSRLALLSLVVLVFAAHGRSVVERHGFVNYDDHAVVDAPEMRNGLGAAVANAAGGTIHHTWLPLYFVSLAVDRAVFGLERPWGFHLVNVLLHALNAGLVFLIVRRLSSELGVALLAAAAFATWPGLVESVAWVASRKDLLSFLLMGGSLLLALDVVDDDAGKLRTNRYVGSIVLLGLGMTAKASVVVLAPMLLVWVFVVPSSPSKSSAHALRGIALLPYFAVAGVMALIHLFIAWGEGVTGAVHGGLLERLVSLPEVVGRYVVSLVLLPIETVHHDVRPGAVGVWWVVGLALIVGLVAAARRARHAHPLIVLGLVWFGVALLPFNNLFPRTTVLMAERYLYVPALGAALAFAVALRRFVPSRVRLGVAAGLIALFVGQSVVRTGVWLNSETLWSDARAKAPSSFVPCFNLAQVYSTKGEFPDSVRAQELFEEARGLARGPSDEIAALKGVAGEYLTRDPIRARTELEAALAIVPVLEADEALPVADVARLRSDLLMNHALANQLVGIEAARRGDREGAARGLNDAAEGLREAMVADPENALAAFNRGTVLTQLGRPKDAIEAFEEAIRRDPGNPESHLSLAKTLISFGHVDRIERALTEAARADAHPIDVELIRVQMDQRTGRTDAAMERLNDLRARFPSDRRPLRALAEVHVDRARLAMHRFDLDGALAAARDAVKFAGHVAETRLLLARVLAARGAFEAAASEYAAAGVAGASPGIVSREASAALVRHAIATTRRGEIEKADEALRRAVRLADDEIDAGGLIVDAPLLELLRAALEDGEESKPLVAAASLVLAGDGKAGREALETLAATTTSRPVAAAAHALRAEAFVASGLPGLAIDPARRAREAAPVSDAAAHLLARSLLAAGRSKDADAIWAELLDRTPGDVRAKLGRIEVTRQAGDDLAVLRAFNQLVESVTGRERKRVRREVAAYYRRKADETEDPSSQEDYLNEAKRHLEVALVDDPYDARTLTRLANILIVGGQTGAAEELLRRALDARADFEPARAELALLNVRKARELMNRKPPEPKPAFIFAQIAVRLDPDSVDTLLTRADASRMLKNYDDAKRDYEAARVFDPTSVGAIDGLALWHKEVGVQLLPRTRAKTPEEIAANRERRDRAMEHFRAAVALDPPNVELDWVREQLAAYDTAGSTDAPRTGLARRVELFLSQAARQLERKSYDNARSITKAALQIDPNSLDAYLFLGNLEMLAGDRGASKAAYERAVELDETAASAHLALANLAFLSGRDDEALARYRAYLLHVDSRSPGAEEASRRARDLIEKILERKKDEDD